MKSIHRRCSNQLAERSFLRPSTYHKEGRQRKNRLLRTRPTFNKSVMVSVGVSVLDCTEIHLIEPGVKANGTYYRDNLLAQKLLPDICRISQGEFFVFPTGWCPGASSTRHCLFPGARNARPYLQHCGRRIHRILTQSTIAYGVCCRRRFTAPE